MLYYAIVNINSGRIAAWRCSVFNILGICAILFITFSVMFMAVWGSSTEKILSAMNDNLKRIADALEKKS